MTTDCLNYESSISSIISAMYIKNDVPFMDAMSLQLAKTLKADHVLIGKLQKNKFSVKTLSHCMDNKIVDGLEYTLKNSPCEIVYEGKVAVYPKHVTHSFPLDQDLINLKIEGYSGIPLFNDKEETFGAIIALYRKPIEDPDFVSSIMTLFAKQIANEIERQQYIQEIESLNKTLESKIEKINEEIEKNKEKGRQLQQQSKLAQMGDMISMIAHQWRQPLNVISAVGINLSLLSSMNILKDEKVQESSKFIQEQIQKMSSTIDTFMNFVKPSKESKPFKLLHTVEEIMQIMGTQLTNHNIKVNIDSKNENISIVGHEDLLEQVIINLLSNARDAFEEQTIENKNINIIIDMKNSIPTITIEDNAGGIPHAIQEKIFNPYFTTKERGKGTGIGLYMSMDIMRKSFGGDLVYSTIDNGSKFEIVCGMRKENIN